LESKVPAATLNLSGAVATGSIAVTPDSIDGLLPKIATSAAAKPSVVNATGNSSASAAADPFAGPATSNATMNFTTVGAVSSTSTRAAVAAPPASAVDTEARNKALPATPQLKPVGRVSLAVEVPLEGTVHHFRKLKDHALIELTVIKPMESRQTSALWMLVLGGAILGGVAGILVSPVLFVSIGMGSIIALKAFSATIIGGFGDVTGSIVGGLLLGVVEGFGAHYISVPYKDAFAFLLLFIFLLLRPQGIFGEKISEKA
jgi:hypothetical protein